MSEPMWKSGRKQQRRHGVHNPRWNGRTLEGMQDTSQRNRLRMSGVTCIESTMRGSLNLLFSVMRKPVEAAVKGLGG